MVSSIFSSYDLRVGKEVVGFGIQMETVVTVERGYRIRLLGTFSENNQSDNLACRVLILLLMARNVMELCTATSIAAKSRVKHIAAPRPA